MTSLASRIAEAPRFDRLSRSAGWHLFHEHHPARWSTLGMAMPTLFQVATLESWTSVMQTSMAGLAARLAVPGEGTSCAAAFSVPAGAGFRR